MTKLTGLFTALSLVTASLGVGGAASAATPTAVPAAATSCSAPGLLFCEDFENLPTGGASSFDWGIDTRNGTMTVEKRNAAPDRGKKILHLRTLDNGRAFLKIEDLDVPAGGFYGRMLLKVDEFPTAPNWAHFTLVEATGSGSSEVVRPVGGQYAPTVPGVFWGIGADGGPTGDWTNWTESAPTTEDRWQCVEWRLDPATNGVTTWFNGVTNPALSVSENSHGGNAVPFVLPDVNTVKIGWQLYQGGTTPGQFDVLIDNVALSTQRLGC
jgi:hypothetical protein